ncbi:MAG: SulP family inorganic anion transporter [Xanthobacteraceae bacterium]
MLSKLAAFRNDITAGAITTIIALPSAIAASLLTFAPLGPDYIAAAAAAGLLACIAGGGLAAILATSSFVGSAPRASETLILATLVVTLLDRPDIAADKGLIVTSVYVCVLLGGLWQCLFGLAGVAKIIKFTPHPVLVGFLNGVAVLIVLSQIKPYFRFAAGSGRLPIADRPAMFALMVATAAAMLLWPAIARRVAAVPVLTKVPPVVVGFFGGIAAYYAIKALVPAVDIGATFGKVTISLVPPLTRLFHLQNLLHLARVEWDILPVSAIVAVVATIDSLLTFRTAQNASELQISPVRDVLAQGLGNCAAAIAGGLTIAASPSQSLASLRAGGRTRVSPLTAVVLLAILAFGFPGLLSVIPTVILSGVLLALGVQLFDRWSFEILAEIRRATSPTSRRRAIYDLAVVFIVMGFTIFYSVLAGVIAGCLLAGAIFVVNMSRPVVRRTFNGGEMQSKRIRPARDVAILRETGAQRAVLQLEGVLFFGNADDLSARIKTIFNEADMIALDLRGVSDIDVSGATILENIIAKSGGWKKELLLCEVPETHSAAIKKLVRKATKSEEPIKPDLDAALEWMEEKTLLLHAHKRVRADVLELRDIDFLAGIDEVDLDRLGAFLARRDFSPGETICSEGEEGDRLWLLAKGSVSVRLSLGDGKGYRRITSLARGTTLGEMALVESARRSATVVADEPVICYELRREDFDRLLAEHPQLATKLLANLSRELARRLRKTSDDLRNLS